MALGFNHLEGKKDAIHCVFDLFSLKRWSSVLSRGGSLFLEPDADVEDSKSHLCTLTNFQTEQ